MILKYGYAKLSIDGVDYEVKPTLSNIANIEDLEEKISAITHPLRDKISYREAFEFLQACVDEPLPQRLEPKYYLGGKVNYIPEEEKAVVFWFAVHCIRHGVSGVSADIDAIESNEQGGKFDALEIIELVSQKYSIPRKDVMNMTMTEVLKVVNPTKPKPRFTKEEIEAWEKATGRKAPKH